MPPRTQQPPSRTPQSSKASSKGNAKPTTPPCHTCRRQRLRCDGAKPACSKCIARGVECLGYGPQALLWVQPKSLKPAHEAANLRGNENHSGGQEIQGREKRRGRPRLVLMSSSPDDDDDTHHRHALLQLRPLQNQKPQQQKRQSQQWIAVSGPNGGRRPQVRSPPCFPGPHAGLEPVDYKNHKLTLDCLAYFNDFVCPDMVLLDTPANPLRAPLEFWRYIPDVVLDILVSTSLTHQLIRAKAHEIASSPVAAAQGNDADALVPIKRNRMSGLHGPSVPVIYKYHQRTLRAVNRELSKTESRYGDLALGIIITLMRVEIQQSAFGAWPAHLEAARAIIAHRGGFSRLATMGDVYVGEGLVNFMLVDVMNSIMTPSWLMDERTTSQTEYIPHLHTIYKDGKDSDFPCPATLMEAIIRTNHVRALSQDKRGRQQQQHREAELDHMAGQILTSIASFNAADWTREHVRALLSPSTSLASSPSSSDTARDSPDEEQQPHGEDGESLAVVDTAALDDAVAAVVDMCTELTKAIQYAALLYCIRTLYMDRRRPFSFSPSSSSDMALDVESAHRSALEMLLAALHRLWDDDGGKPKTTDWCGKLSFWPLFIAGMEMDPAGPPESRAERDFVCGALRRLVYYLGDLSPLDAVSVLQLIWRKTAAAAAATATEVEGEEQEQEGGGCSGQQRFSWDERLVMPGIRGLYFF
ncbi:hypothetical protein JDV02_002081 [Purpureocillium takamizusanense]|uniref:Zn(2)-C6 fungal-type domain-containing protein n=1 Tax=Purpureocillium takamizusanense TaxID=2060973 RepID=A0A9Q8QAU7_9HYPO|nr:uncharacterized protein JDV02_002081 [Purpureocillium takamizusanense]UNI15556.1 hypothetical protein JDV02_002081 [Purpureocillium takamizusanense]